MTYVHPGKKTFEILSQEGSAVIRDRVLRRMFETEAEASREDLRAVTQITPQNYEFKLLGTEVRQGRLMYLLDASPNRNNKFMMRGRIWVDGEDFAITRVEGTPAQNPSMLLRNTAIVQQYEKTGAFWLPVSNHSETDSFVFGKTEVIVTSSDYEIERAGGAPAAAP